VNVKSTAEGRVGTLVWQASAQKPNCRKLPQDELPRKPIRRSSANRPSGKFALMVFSEVRVRQDRHFRLYET
jgi:hypothetical protein